MPAARQRVRTTGSASEFSSSEYAKTIHGIVAGAPPAIDLAAEKRLIDCLVKLASESAIFSAHDVSDGGIAVTLAESCFASDGLSAQIDLGSILGKRRRPPNSRFSANAARARSCRSRPRRLLASRQLRHNTMLRLSKSARSRAANFASNIRVLL